MKRIFALALVLIVGLTVWAGCLPGNHSVTVDGTEYCCKKIGDGAWSCTDGRTWRLVEFPYP